MGDTLRIDLTARDFEVLEVLTHRVRVLSLHQVARTWWPASSAGRKLAGERLRLLVRESLIELFRAPAHPELPLSSPLVTWTPGKHAPDFGAVSFRLQSRWSESPKPTLFAAASKKAGNRFGGHGGRMPVGTHRTHDLHMAGVYLLLRKADPISAKQWVFEERIRRSRKTTSEKLPDAIIQIGTTKKVVEFGGAYSKYKLEAFHEYCCTEELPYEVW